MKASFHALRKIIVRLGAVGLELNGHTGNGRKRDVRTPVMAAKIADHKWTVEELLSTRT
jgi:hypothetical protein